MPNSNEKIRQDLARHEVLLRDIERDPSIFQMIAEAFRGFQSGLNILGGVFQLIFMGLTIWAGMKFFEVSQTRDHIFWATVFLTCFGITTSFKIWFWMVINRNAVIREVKRLELQVARLAEQIARQD